MPLVNGKLLTPDDAIAQGLCPETGVDLYGVNIEDHITRLWGTHERQELRNPEVFRRQQLLRDYATAHPETQPKYDSNRNLIEMAPRQSSDQLAIAALTEKVAALTPAKVGP
jgi:hypothetical protein